MHSDEPDLPLGRVMTPVSPAPWPCTISSPSPSPSCLPFLLLSFFLSTPTFLPVPSILLRPTSPTPPPHPLPTYPFSPPSPHSFPHPPNPLPSPGAWRGAYQRVPRGKRALGLAGLIVFFNRWTPVLPKVANRFPDCTSGTKTGLGQCHLQSKRILVSIVLRHKHSAPAYCSIGLMLTAPAATATATATGIQLRPQPLSQQQPQHPLQSRLQHQSWAHGRTYTDTKKTVGAAATSPPTTGGEHVSCF